MSTLESVQKLQTALRAKAKQSPAFRFYSLQDKIYRKDVLHSAWRRCRSNDGGPGVDEQNFADIEKYGVVQTAVLIVLEPIFEVDLQPERLDSDFLGGALTTVSFRRACNFRFSLLAAEPALSVL